jgi:hypothetical protein
LAGARRCGGWCVNRAMVPPAFCCGFVRAEDVSIPNTWRSSPQVYRRMWQLFGASSPLTNQLSSCTAHTEVYAVSVGRIFVLLRFEAGGSQSPG